MFFYQILLLLVALCHNLLHLLSWSNNIVKCVNPHLSLHCWGCKQQICPRISFQIKGIKKRIWVNYVCITVNLLRLRAAYYIPKHNTSHIFLILTIFVPHNYQIGFSEICDKIPLMILFGLPKLILIDFFLHIPLYNKVTEFRLGEHFVIPSHKTVICLSNNFIVFSGFSILRLDVIHFFNRE